MDFKGGPLIYLLSNDVAIFSLFYIWFFIERNLHDYASTLPKNRIFFAYIVIGALILTRYIFSPGFARIYVEIIFLNTYALVRILLDF